MSEQPNIHQFFRNVPSGSRSSAASPVLPSSQLSTAQIERIQRQKEEAIRRRAQIANSSLSCGSSNGGPLVTADTSIQLPGLGSSLVTYSATFISLPLAFLISASRLFCNYFDLGKVL